MAKILVMGAGSAQSNGVIKCLLDSKNSDQVISAGSEATDLIFCKAEKKYLIPHSTSDDYKGALLGLIRHEKPDLIHFQHDMEIFVASLFRKEIEDLGTKVFLPSHQEIDVCVHKYKSYEKFRDSGIKVPKNIILNNEKDLQLSFKELGYGGKKIWLRSTLIGGGGKGSVATSDFDFAKKWIDHNSGWGDFAAAEILTKDSVTFASIWYEGELVVAQTRIRRGWSGRSVSGVTGVTKVGETYSNDLVTKIAIDSIKAVSKKPHGIFGVDMTYDSDSIPNPTEINIGRFFTTVQFFKEAGLNMPEIFKDIAIYSKMPNLVKKINPIRDGMLWLRAMDEEPILVKNIEDIFSNVDQSFCSKMIS